MHIIKEEIDTMLAVESLHDAVLLVFATKQDLRGAVEVVRAEGSHLAYSG